LIGRAYILVREHPLTRRGFLVLIIVMFVPPAPVLFWFIGMSLFKIAIIAMIAGFDFPALVVDVLLAKTISPVKSIP